MARQHEIYSSGKKMANQIDINNVDQLFKKLDQLLTEEDKVEIVKETWAYVNAEGYGSGCSDKDAFYFLK
jgi:methionine salvage enolase-phosphatase E1